MNVYSSHEVEEITVLFVGQLISRGIIEEPTAKAQMLREIFAKLLIEYDLKQKIKNEKDERDPNTKRPWT